MFLKVGVSLGEVATSEKAAMCGKWRGMGSLQNQMSPAVDHFTFFVGIGAPKHEYKVVPAGIEFRNGPVGKGFPALTLVRAGSALLHGKHAVEQEHSLAGPVLEVAVPEVLRT